VQALIAFFIELCLLRRPPQDLPASDVLLAMVLVTDLIVGMLVGMTAGLSWIEGFLQSLVEVALMLTALYLTLKQLRLAQRFVQSGTALLGSGTLLGLIALIPLSLNPTGSETTDLATLGAFLLLGLIIWGVVVTGHILRHSFGITLGQGAAIAIAFEIFAVTLVTSLFGGA